MISSWVRLTLLSWSAKRRRPPRKPFRRVLLDLAPLEDRTLPATLSIVGNTLTYIESSGINHILTISHSTGSPGTYIIVDSENFTAVPPGWSGAASRTAVGPDTGITSGLITTGAGNDQINIQSTGQPFTVNSGAGDDDFNVTRGNGTFDLRLPQLTGNSPRSVAVGDFTGDGNLDLVTANYFPSTVSVLLGNGDLSFVPQATFTTGTNPDYVAVADLNTDGKLDLAVTNLMSNNVSILLGNGNGTFAPQTTFGTGGKPVAVVIDDFDRDGKLDLAVTNNQDASVSILQGSGNGLFFPQVTFAAGNTPGSLAVGTFDADNTLDLAIVNGLDNTVSVLRGNGDGSFTSPFSFATGAFAYFVAAGDFNADGKLDLAVANLDSDNVSVLLGNGDGLFQSQTTFAVGDQPRFVGIADLNGDGKLDLFAANGNNSNVGVLLGNGNGTFGAQTTFTTGPLPLSLALADFNSDGRADLAVAEANGNNVSVLPAKPGDLTGLGGTLILDRGSGANRLLVDEGGSTANDTVTVAATSISSNVVPFSIALPAVAGSLDIAVRGGTGNNTLIRPAGDIFWTVVQQNAGLAGAVAFANFGNLTGGTGNDTFAFLSNGAVTGDITGGTGSNTLDYSQRPGANVTVTAPGVGGSGFNGFGTAIGGIFRNINSFVGTPDGAPSTVSLTNNINTQGSNLTLGGAINFTITGSITGGGTVFLQNATLNGTGTVGVPLLVTGGTVSPGLGAPGTLNTLGVNFDAASNLKVFVSTDGSDSTLSADGDVVLNNAVLDVSLLGGTFGVGQTFVIVESSGNVLGTFLGLPDGAVFTINGQSFRIDYVGPAGGGLEVSSQVLLIVVPAVVPPISFVIPRGVNVFITGADAGGGPDVRIFNAATHALIAFFFAYDPNFTGGVRVAVGDVNGDGFLDVITAAGPGGGPNVAVYSGNGGALLASFYALPEGFTGGVNVAAGDINRDGLADIISGADAGGGPNITFFSITNTGPVLRSSFYAYSPDFTGGVRVASADVNGDSFADVICGAGPGGGPNVTVFSGQDDGQTRLFSFFAFDPSFTNGIYVAGGDSSGDGRAEIYVGAGRGGGPNVTVFNGSDAAMLNSFFVFPPDFFGGVRVGAARQPTGRTDLVAVEGPQTNPNFGALSTPAVNIFEPLSGAPVDSFFALNPAFTGGLYVAGNS